MEIRFNEFSAAPDLLDRWLNVLAGPSYIGKTSLALEMSYCVCTGISFMGYTVNPGPVRHYALEESMECVMERMEQMYSGVVPDALHITAREQGFDMDELQEFAEKHPDARLVVIDSMQQLRGYGFKNDHHIIAALKDFAEAYHICVMLVYRTKKKTHTDIVNLRGDNGPFADVDGVLTLAGDCESGSAVFEAQAKHLPRQRCTLKWDNKRIAWELDGDGTPLPDPIVAAVTTLVTKDTPFWQETPEELVKTLDLDMAPNTLSRRLNAGVGKQLGALGIHYKSFRSNGKRLIELKYIPTAEICEDE